ncbi:PLDc N-terminal domain-containing protein [Amycolatopsis sp. H20-H5]|uniref:PLDc N-terminal domain-containing protein n=1 Tax=Amycolatopsis sp. H20-H5 TaxID=3046309 RepID=UPI002DB69EFF|nr:PLDc N-terminal domain-containing protein [Amycolatopsis sp. H20-H5]MEC3975251.1 PLDc N-terminal domain-containing protein [Amycolatopsis sp. H20-H5]
MLYFDGLLGCVTLGLWIFCLVDVVVTEEGSCRNLSKGLWLLLVLLLPLVGSIIWLVAGRPEQQVRARRGPYERHAPSFPEYDRPGRFAAGDSAGDEEFLLQCRERAEAQRRQAREKQSD